jgi:flagellar biosynthesis chaperone FliJ
MKKIITALTALVLGFTCGYEAHGAEKCAFQRRAFDRASSDYARAENNYNRFQQQVDSRAEQGEYRRAVLEGNVEMARGNVSAAQQGSVGQGISCFFPVRANCFRGAINRAVQQVARAKAMLRAQEGRLAAFDRAFNRQMTRLSERVTKQEEIVKQKKIVVDTKESEYNACMKA